MRIDGLSNNQAAIAQSIGDTLGKLEVGDIVKAKILEITGGELLLKMMDGTEFKAATAANIEAKPGDTLELMVNGKADGKLFMETLRKAGSGNSDGGFEIKLQLAKLDVEPDGVNLQLAASLKASGTALSKEILDKAVALMKQASQISPENAAFLAAKGLELPEKNTNMLINLLNGKLKLGSELDGLMKQIAGAIELSAAELGADAGAPGIPQQFKNQNNMDPLQNNTLNATPSTVTAAKGGENRIVSDTAVSTGANAKIQTGEQIISNTQPAFPKGETGNIPSQDREKINDPSVRKDNMIIQKNAANNIENDRDSQAFRASLKSDASVMLSQKVDIDSAENSGNKVHESVKAAVRLLKDTGDLFVKIKSDSLKSDLEVKKVFDGILNKLDDLKEVIQSSSIQGREEILNKLDTVQDSMRLLNQVGGNTLYAQIPLNMSGFNTTAELFVMKRNAGRKRIDPGNAVLFLSLDTHNIGTVQSIVEIKGKTVGVNLRAEMPEIIDFMKENMTGLYTSLSQSGYKLVDVRYRLISEPSGLSGMEKEINEEFKARQTGIDYRI